jgi:hypothetical protein
VTAEVVEERKRIALDAFNKVLKPPIYPMGLGRLGRIALDASTRWAAGWLRSGGGVPEMAAAPSWRRAAISHAESAIEGMLRVARRETAAPPPISVEYLPWALWVSASDRRPWLVEVGWP